MFRNTYQSGFLSILYSIGSKPLSIWDKNGKWSVVLSNRKGVVCTDTETCLSFFRSFVRLQCVMVTSRESLTETFSLPFSKLWAQTLAQYTLLAQLTQPCKSSYNSTNRLHLCVLVLALLKNAHKVLTLFFFFSTFELFSFDNSFDNNQDAGNQAAFLGYDY